MTIALTVMANSTVAMPAAVYSIFMYIFAAIFGALISRHATQESVIERA
jgi:BASS family bile acid:Na+ symporter